MTEPHKPLEQMSPQERLDLGNSYYNDGRFDEAITAWLSICRNDDPETYARAQFNLGAAYYAQKKIDQAIEAWSNIHREKADSDTYGLAQLGLGNAYHAQNKIDQAISAWSNIHREKADSETYSEAQFNLGLAYYAQEDLEQAIKTWSNVPHDDNSETYAQAQLNLGAAYAASGKPDEAITAWSNVPHDDNSETYAQAQFNLGAAYAASGKPDEAITAWSNVPHDDNSETYARAQLNLGAAYYVQEDWEQAIKTWSNIHREEADSETYAQAQLGLGVAYAKSGKSDEVITAWSNIHHEKADSETYARAQLGLGAAYYLQKDWEQAIKTWSNIHHEKADSETYARAQLGLGAAYVASGKPDQAIKTLSSIRREKIAPEIYAQAQLGLGEIHKYKGNIKQAKDAYRNVQGPLYYSAQREYRILGCPPELINDLRSLAKNTDKVRESLQIIPDFESEVAHYSRASTAFSLFGDEKNDKEPSHFRLSTIRGVNDPAEGLVLNDYWDQQGIPETVHTNNTATFISCFTFNHDSLNQFRLYGKENGQEATGVSLVFKKEFFSDQTDTLEFIAGPSTDPSSKPEQIKPNDTGKTEIDNKKPSIGKSTLYRCIYLDPETGYWTLAQRDKSTFYRKNKEKETAKKNWRKYSKKISEIEKSFKDYLFNKNDSILEKLKYIFKEYNKYGAEEKQKILEVVRFILLPLQYLVKHIAFQEEQECRIMYITHLHDEKIHHDWKTQEMYVEYEEPVLPHIDKIYLSPGSAKYQDFFRILLDQKEDDEPDKKEDDEPDKKEDENESKVHISQNPFRNKE